MVNLGVKQFGCTNSGPLSRFQVCVGGKITHQNLFSSLRNLKAIVTKWNLPNEFGGSDSKKQGLRNLVKETSESICGTGSFTAQFLVKILIASGLINRPELADHGFIASGTITFRKMVESLGGLGNSNPGEKQMVINQIVATAARAMSVTTDVADNVFCEMYRSSGKKQPGYDLYAVGQAVYKAQLIDGTWKTGVYIKGGLLCYVDSFIPPETGTVVREKRKDTQRWWNHDCIPSDGSDGPFLRFTMKVAGAAKIPSYNPKILQLPEDKVRRRFARLWAVGDDAKALAHFNQEHRVATKQLQRRPKAHVGIGNTDPPITIDQLWAHYVQESLQACDEEVRDFHPLTSTGLFKKYNRVAHGLFLEPVPKHTKVRTTITIIHKLCAFLITFPPPNSPLFSPSSADPDLLLPGQP